MFREPFLDKKPEQVRAARGIEVTQEDSCVGSGGAEELTGWTHTPQFPLGLNDTRTNSCHLWNMGIIKPNGTLFRGMDSDARLPVFNSHLCFLYLLGLLQGLNERMYTEFLE